MRAVSTIRALTVRLIGPTGGWKRAAVALVTPLVVAGGLALAAGKPGTLGLQIQPIAIEARPISGFDKEHPEKTRFGRLEWRGGLVLTSQSANFGGWSGLAIDAGGKSIIAVSDAGTWLTAELAYEGKRPLGLASARLGPLLSVDKKVLTRNRDRDAESVTLVDGTPGGGNLLVSFEGNDRIGRFGVSATGVAAPSGYLKLPPEVTRVRSNDGLEAVSVLRGGPMKGAVVAFTENLLAGEANHAGWIWIAGEPKRVSLTDIGGFEITDAAGLGDGGLLVLERRFRWNEGVKMRLRLIKAQDVKPGALMSGEVLIEADLNQEIDNMEGLAVHTEPNGTTVLTLISDDNFNPLLQRTVLLQFALPASSVAAR